jgi:hypothetical protein
MGGGTLEMKTRRIACVTVYEEDSVIIRTSLVINRIKGNKTENLLFQEDWFEDRHFESEETLIKRLHEVTTDYVDKAVELDAEIRMIDQPVELKRCSCGACNGFLTNEIRAEDLLKEERQSTHLLH